MAIIPIYLPRDRSALESHYAALDLEDLRNRFCGSIRPGMVSQYIDQMTVSGVPMYGIFNSEHTVVAVCQLGQSERELEVGLTVLRLYRRRSLGRALLTRSASYARARGLRSLVIHCLAGNMPMMSLARRMGMRVQNCHGDMAGRWTLRAGNLLDFWTEIAYDQEGIAGSVMRSWRLATTTHPAETPRV
jgi:GNAT superfamily N-acetyltransferase